MNSENILNVIKDKISIKGKDLIAPNNSLNSGHIIVKTKFFNEIISDMEEIRLKDIVRNYDQKENKSVFSVISSQNLTPLNKVVEGGKIPTNKLEQLKKVNSEIYKLAGIIEFNIDDYEDDEQLSEFIIEALNIELIKSENNEIISVLDNKEGIVINSVNGKIDGDSFLNAINNNLNIVQVKKGAIISNYEFYKSINTYENLSTGILKLVNDNLYYMNKPLYVMDDSYFKIKTPVAFVGNFKRAVGFIQDKQGNTDISINFSNSMFNVGQARAKVHFDVKELISESFIKVVASEG